jgi:hypothetical protein
MAPLAQSQDGGIIDTDQEVGVAATAAANTVSATNAAATLTFAATAAKRWRLAAVEWSFSANPAAAAALTVKDGVDTVWSVDITTGGPGFLPIDPDVIGTVNTALEVSLAAGGAAVVGKVNARPILEK